MSDFFDSSAQLNLLLERSMPLLKIVAVHLTCFFYAVLLSTIENKSSYHAWVVIQNNETASDTEG